MKELSIEEKACRYDEAIERYKAKQEYESQKVHEFIEYLFPELKESEDEKIRKEIIYHIQNCDDTIDEVTEKRMLAWLEKQDEHANFRNKIKIGDKVTRNKDGVLVNLSQLNRVAKKDEKQGEQKSTNEVGNYDHKEVIQTIINEQNHDWSEEDKKLINDTCHLINTLASGYGEKVTEPITFSGTQMIASIKDRLRALVDNRPQSTWKPSGEQMEILQYLCETSSHPNEKVIPTLESLYQDLLKLKE